MQLVFYLTTFSTPCMDHLLYLMFRCDKGCDRKFGNFVGSKHTLCALPWAEKGMMGQLTGQTKAGEAAWGLLFWLCLDP